MASKYSAEELAQLSEEEREGLAELEAEERAESGDDGAEDGAAEDTGKSAGEAGAGADAGAAAAPDPAATPTAAEAPPPPVTDRGGAPFPTYELPADYEQRIKTLETQRAQVAQQFDDGDLTGAELNQKLAALNREEQDLRETKLRAEISYDARLEGWKMSATSFIEANPQYAPGTPLFNMLDAQVKTLQEAATNPFDPKILAEADAKVKEQVAEIARLTGMAPPPATPAAKPAAAAAQTPAAAAATAAAAAAAEKPAIPPTLATIPAAALEDTGQGSEFAHLDRLAQTDIAKYEAALARLTPEQLERYEQGG